MASAYSSTRNRQNAYPPAQLSPRRSVVRSRSQSQDNDPNDQTRNIVEEFKAFVQTKLDENAELNRNEIEMGVSLIRRRLFRERCKISRWKANLPKEIEHCPDDILIRSIAYGNDPTEVKSIIEEKINSSDSTVGSIDKLISPLKKLQTDLERNPHVNLLDDVRNHADNDVERANRLFYSEALHGFPGVTDYTYENAAEAVQGIRDCDYESNDNRYLYSVIKVCKTAEDVRDHLEQELGRSSKQQSTISTKSPSTHRKYSTSDEDQNSPPRRPERR